MRGTREKAETVICEVRFSDCHFYLLDPDQLQGPGCGKAFTSTIRYGMLLISFDMDIVTELIHPRNLRHISTP